MGRYGLLPLGEPRSGRRPVFLQRRNNNASRLLPSRTNRSRPDEPCRPRLLLFHSTQRRAAASLSRHGPRRRILPHSLRRNHHHPRRLPHPRHCRLPRKGRASAGPVRFCSRLQRRDATLLSSGDTKAVGGHPTLTPQRGVIMPGFPTQPVLSPQHELSIPHRPPGPANGFVLCLDPQRRIPPSPRPPVVPHRFPAAKSGQNNSASIFHNS